MPPGPSRSLASHFGRTRSNASRRSPLAPSRPFRSIKGRARSRTRNPKLLWFQAALLREPNNPHDRNAIAVHASGIGHVGYLDRETAIQYLPVFDELARQGVAVGACPAILTGEPGVTTLGVVLCLSSPEAVIGDLRGE